MAISTSPPPGTPVCDECTAGPPASYLCVDCNLPLCRECHTFHTKSKRTSQHSTRLLETPGSQTVSDDKMSARSSPESVGATRSPVGSVDAGAFYATNFSSASYATRDDEYNRLYSTTQSTGSQWSYTTAKSSASVTSPTGAVQPQDAVTTENQTNGKKCLLMWRIKLTRAHMPNWRPANVKEDDVQHQEPGWLGVEFMNRRDGHLIITKIQSGGPADGNQGIMTGDVLVAIDGKMAKKQKPHELRQLVMGSVGSEIFLTLGAEFIPHKAYTQEHELASGEKVPVRRVVQPQTAPTEQIFAQDHVQMKMDKLELSGSELLTCSLRIQDQSKRYGVTASGTLQQLVSPRGLSPKPIPMLPNDASDDETWSDEDFTDVTDVTDGSISPRSVQTHLSPPPV